MHQHWTFEDWLDAFGDSEVDAPVVHDCAEARALWPDLGPWVAHATACPRCRDAAPQVQLLPDDVLDCPQCLEAADFVWTMVQDLDHFDPAVARELPAAEESLHVLAPLPLDEQKARVRSDPRYQRWGLCHRLLVAAKSAWLSDPQLAHDRAALAVTVAELLNPDGYHPQWLADLQAKAHAYLANAHRIQARFSEAEHHFLAAEDKLRQGVGIRAEAQVLALKASLLIDQYRYTEALALLDRIEAHYRSHKAWHEVGRLCMKRGLVLEAQEQFELAAQEHARAASLLDPEVEDHLIVLARQNVVDCLVKGEKTEQARRLFEELPKAAAPSISIRRDWIEGHILGLEGHYDRALYAYERARESWSGQGLHYSAALVTMDMALAAYAAGDLPRVATYAEEASVLLVRAAAKHEAFAALNLLFRAIEGETLSRTVLQTLRQRLAKLQPS